MPCTIAKKDRVPKMQELVLTYFQNLAGAGVSLETSLGPNDDGLGHTPVKRKLYYADLRDALKASGCGCTMQNLTPAKFGKTPLYSTVGTIADMLAKDIG